VYDAIESKILRVCIESVFNNIFLTVAPNYTDQLKAALEHVKQLFTDSEGKEVYRSVQVYYTQIIAAIQPFVGKRDFPVNVAKKFKSNMDPGLSSFFKQAYPQHTTVVPLESGLQLAALRAMLAAAQKAEENRKMISATAISAMNTQAFMLQGASTAGVNASQAERTIADFKKKDLACFGCDGPHMWSTQKPDKSYVVTCPSKDKPGVREKADAKIAEICTKRKGRKDREDKRKKDREDKRKKPKATANA